MALKIFKWPPENAEGGQTWPSKFLTWGQHWICVWLFFVEVLEEALNETDAGGLMADLLLMMLTAVFSLEEEEEQEELELAKESKDQGM